MSKEKTQMLLQLEQELKDEIDEHALNNSAFVRESARACIDVVGEEGLDEDMQELNRAILRTWKSAIEKNIQVMKQQRDKIDGRLEELEEDKVEDDVIVEINLDALKKSINNEQ